MPDNIYPYTGPGTRWNQANPTAKDFLDVARINVDHIHEALNFFIDSLNYKNGLLQTGNAVTVDTTINAMKNAVSTGPLTINAAITVTFAGASRWTHFGPLTLGAGAKIVFGAGSELRII